MVDVIFSQDMVDETRAWLEHVHAEQERRPATELFACFTRDLTVCMQQAYALCSCKAKQTTLHAHPGIVAHMRLPSLTVCVAAAAAKQSLCIALDAVLQLHRQLWHHSCADSGGQSSHAVHPAGIRMACKGQQRED